MGKWVYLAMGGVAGTWARYWLGGIIDQGLGASFPFGTLVVNLTGCLVVGFLSAVVDEKFFLGPESRAMLMIGFCGAYTTLSTLMLETSNMIRDGETMKAFLNILLSVVIGFIAFRVGVLLGEIV